MNNEIYELLNAVFSKSNKNHYITCRKQLIQLFESYTRLEQGELKTLLEHLVKCDKVLCAKSRNTTYMREHNTFVIRYFSKNRPTFMQISIMQNVSLKQVYIDIDKTLDRLMVGAYGIYGLKI